MCQQRLLAADWRSGSDWGLGAAVSCTANWDSGTEVGWAADRESGTVFGNRGDDPPMLEQSRYWLGLATKAVWCWAACKPGTEAWVGCCKPVAEACNIEEGRFSAVRMSKSRVKFKEKKYCASIIISAAARMCSCFARFRV